MDAHRRFDAPVPPSTTSRVARAIAHRWGVALAWLVVVAILGAIAGGLLFVDRLRTVAIDAGIASTSLFVVVDPKATAVETDAIGPRIKALPGVADATPRPRDAALASLVANGLPPPEGRNPLPDVWIVRPSAATGAAGFAASVGQLRTALAALPQVVAVRVDERWVGRLDDTIATARLAVSRILVIGGSVVVLLLACVGWLAANALTVPAEAPSGKSVLALCGALVSSIAVLVDAAALAIFSATWKPNAVGLIEQSWQRFSADAPAPLALTALGIVVVCTVAACFARPSTR